MRPASSTRSRQWARGLTRRSLLCYLDVSFAGSGLLNGAKLAEKLAEAIGDLAIDKLPVRYAAIATEIGTGHEIWITRGRLTDALRASYALPGIFPPVRLGERWLVDGALVNPVPVSVARALGARLVIAVNVNTDLFGRGTTMPDLGDEPEPSIEEEVASRGLFGLFGAEKTAKRRILGTASRPGLSTVMVEAFNIMQDRITRARLAGDPPDIMISPRVGQIGLFDFHRAQEAIARRRRGGRARARGTRRGRGGAGVGANTTLRRRDVLAQRVGLALDLLEPPLHHVADRDDADEPALLHDRKMAEFARGHPLHDRRDGVGFGAGHHLARHHRRDIVVERRRPALAQATARCRARTGCRRPDCPDRSPPRRRCGAAARSSHGFGQARGRRDRRHVAALARQDCSYRHGLTSLLGAPKHKRQSFVAQRGAPHERMTSAAWRR